MILFAVHGYPLDHRMWEPLAAHLPRGVRLVAPDLRGRGASMRRALAIHTMAQHADDVAEEIAALPTDEPLVLAGLSMGGYILLELLRRHAEPLRERLRGVVLCDTRATPDDAAGRAGRLSAIAAIRERGIDAARDAMLPKLLSPGNRERLSPAVERMILDTPPATACADLAGMAERSDGFGALAALTTPLLIVVGAQDLITPPADSEAMAQAASTLAAARVVRIEDAGHMAPLEKPAEVARAMGHLLASSDGVIR